MKTSPHTASPVAANTPSGGTSATSRTPREIDYGPLPTLVGYQVRNAYSRLFQTFTEMFSELGLAPGQYSALLLIGLNPGLSQMALADATGIDRSTIVPITGRFAKAGWIRRTRRRTDRRVYSLRLTPSGASVLKKAESLVAAHEKQFVAMLSPEEREVLRSLLARIADRGPAGSTDRGRQASPKHPSR